MIGNRISRADLYMRLAYLYKYVEKTKLLPS